MKWMMYTTIPPTQKEQQNTANVRYWKSPKPPAFFKASLSVRLFEKLKSRAIAGPSLLWEMFSWLYAGAENKDGS
jgi:hypothetical protein